MLWPSNGLCWAFQPLAHALAGPGAASTPPLPATVIAAAAAQATQTLLSQVVAPRLRASAAALQASQGADGAMLVAPELEMLKPQYVNTAQPGSEGALLRSAEAFEAFRCGAGSHAAMKLT